MNPIRLGLLMILTATCTAAESQPPPGSQPSRPASGLPDGVKAFRDLAYVENGHERQKLDLFLPPGDEAARPLVIWIHGGGWQGGSKERGPFMALLHSGFAVASVGYRLTDAARFPAQIEDCKAAVRWLRAHAKEHRLDPERFGAWGTSAGAHLVALLGTSGDVKELEGKLGNNDQSSRVQAVCAMSGPADFPSMDGWQVENPQGAVFKLLGGSLAAKAELAKLASAATHASKDDPPFLILHGDADLLVPLKQGQRLEETLKAKGVDAKLDVLKGMGHGLSGPIVVGKAEAFFKEKLGKKN